MVFDGGVDLGEVAAIFNSLLKSFFGDADRNVTDFGVEIFAGVVGLGA
jgi:hypothetical protein